MSRYLSLFHMQIREISESTNEWGASKYQLLQILGIIYYGLRHIQQTMISRKQRSLNTLQNELFNNSKIIQETLSTYLTSRSYLPWIQKCIYMLNPHISRHFYTLHSRYSKLQIKFELKLQEQKCNVALSRFKNTAYLAKCINKIRKERWLKKPSNKNP